MQGLAPLHRAIYLRLAPHFGAGLFSLLPLRNPQSCDRRHTAARRHPVDNVGLGEFSPTRRGPVAGGTLGTFPRSHFPFSPDFFV